MAIRIGTTPVLTGKEAAKFIVMVYKDAKKPASPVPTPKLEEATELVRRHAERRQKHIH